MLTRDEGWEEENSEYAEKTLPLTDLFQSSSPSIQPFSLSRPLTQFANPSPFLALWYAHHSTPLPFFETPPLISVPSATASETTICYILPKILEMD